MTLGELFRRERLKQHKTVQDIAAKTRIRPAILEQIEKGEYEKLPSRTYVKGFVQAYAQALKMDKEKAMAFFRREYDIQEQSERIPPQPLIRPGWVITPGKLLMAGGTVLLLLFFGFLFWQYRQFAGRPVLIVDQPVDQMVNSETSIVVSGRTDPEATVSINGEVVSVSPQGTFEITITLQEGTNRLTVTARNQLGKETIIQRDIQVTGENS